MDFTRLAELALQFGRINRSFVYHPGEPTDGLNDLPGQPESNTDHTVMLGWVACSFADQHYPELNLGRIAQLALVHDMPEVLCGDTPTLRITRTEMLAKAEREQDAVARLRREFGRGSWVGGALRTYERQELREARFVRAIDKCLPKLVHLLDGGRGLREARMGRAEFLERLRQQRFDMVQYAGEFPRVIVWHRELAETVADLVWPVAPVAQQ